MTTPTLWGPEFLINTTTLNGQRAATVTALADGRFVVTWEDLSDQFGSSSIEVRAQVFNADGSKSGGEILVNTTSAGRQWKPSVTALADGGFVVAWEDESATGGDTSDSAIRAQVFSADGTKSGSEFLVNTTTAGEQWIVDIATLSDGRFVVTWTDDSGAGGTPPVAAIRAQVFNADGTTSGSELQVNTTTAAQLWNSAVEGLSDGRFVVAWEDYGQSGGDTSGTAVRAQIFNANGSLSGTEFLVNTTTLNDQARPDIAALAEGRFVVTWQDRSSLGGDSSFTGVRAQVFNANGTKSGAEFLVNTTIVAQQERPAIASMDDGRFAVAWQDGSVSSDDPSSWAIRAQVFNPDGTKSGAEFLVNTNTANAQVIPTIATLADGRLVVAWEDLSLAPGDTSSSAIRGQIVDPRLAAIDLAGTDLGDDFVGTVFDDTIAGDLGNDRLAGDAGNDTLFGGAGNDTLYGGAGDDTLGGGGSGTSNQDVFYGGDGDDRLIRGGGGSGEDAYFGGAGNDTIDGDSFDFSSLITFNLATGRELLLGIATVAVWDGFEHFDNSGSAGGAERVIGTAGANYIATGGGANSISAGDGDDTVDAGAGGDQVFGDAGNDTLAGGAGADLVYGGAGNDSIAGDSGSGDADVVYGGAGDDRIGRGFGSTNQDAHYGGAGNDTIDVANRQFTPALAAHWDLGAGTLAGLGGSFQEIWDGFEHFDGSGAISTTSVTITGTGGTNVILTTDGADTIHGLGGDDTIRTAGGNDVIDGGAGNDTLDAGTGTGTVTGGVGDDVIVHQRTGPSAITVTDFGAIHFAITLDGAQENPSVVTSAGGTGTAVLNHGGTRLVFDLALSGLDLNGAQTGTTSDNVTGAHFHAAPVGTNGPVRFNILTDAETAVNAAAGTISGGWDAGEGNNTTLTAQLSTLLAGGLYVNVHTVANPGGEIRGQVLAQDTGGDRIDLTQVNIGEFSTVQALLSDVSDNAQLTTYFDGQASTLILQGVASADLTAADFIFAGAGSQTLDGTANADDLFGGADGDRLSGLAGTDRLFGESGNDTLEGGDGGDTLAGGAGADTLDGGAGNDTADYSGSAAAVAVGLGAGFAAGGDAAGDVLTGIENLVGSNHNDVLLGDSGANTIDGGAGSDVLSGEAGSDVLIGGAGFDALSGADGGAGAADTLFGGADLDIAYYFTATSSQVVDFNDRANLATNSGEHTLDTWDSIEGFYGANAHSNTIRGDGQDNLFLGGDQADTLYGGGGSDILTARGGDDLIYGGAGNDFISGDAGNDDLYGDAGSDIFYIFATSDVDRLRDFSITDDSLLFYQTGATQWSDLTSTQVGNDVHVTLSGAGFTVVVANVLKADLDGAAGGFTFL